MPYQIKKIDATVTLPIRHKVMWPDMPLEYVKLPNDEKGSHYGLFVAEKLIAVISLFVEGDSVQFRKFATVSEFQGKGFGSKLLAYIITIVKKEKHKRIWCNARVDKVGFYHQFGFKETKTHFTKGGIAYVVMERSF